MARPKPRVAIARYGPSSRNAGTPMITPSAAVTSTAAGSVATNDQPSFASAPWTYAPAARKPAWPRETWPVRPTRIPSESATNA